LDIYAVAAAAAADAAWFTLVGKRREESAEWSSPALASFARSSLSHMQYEEMGKCVM